MNGTAQQGLVRFAVKSLATNKQGPQGSTELKPTTTGLAPGTVRVAWQAAWDRDNRQLTYEVLRGATTATSTVIATRTQDSSFWNRPPMAFTDRTAAPGSSQTYRVRVKDALGNTVVSSATAVTVPTGTASTSAYADAVTTDAPADYWRLGESDGTVGYDWASGNDLTLASDTQHGVAGAIVGDADAASGFSGSATVPAVSAISQPGPQTFSVEAWFRTTSTSGGKIVGFGDSATGNSNNYDRQLYLTNDGKLVFGVYSGGVQTVSGSRSYNDGAWHQAVATLGASGETLYVDGKKVGTRADVTAAQPFSGYWRWAATTSTAGRASRRAARSAVPSTRSRCTRRCCRRPGSRPTTVPPGTRRSCPSARPTRTAGRSGTRARACSSGSTRPAAARRSTP